MSFPLFEKGRSGLRSGTIITPNHHDHGVGFYHHISGGADIRSNKCLTISRNICSLMGLDLVKTGRQTLT